MHKWPRSFCTHVGVALACCLIACSTSAQQLPPPPDGETHRPLRTNPPGAEPLPVEPQTFSAYPDAPAFSVVPRQGRLTFFPCEGCHEAMPPNPQRRQLYSPHPAGLDHGAGRIWCLDCHDAEDRNQLHTFAGAPVAFDDAYQVCGQCHYQPQKDWYYGAHGKRVANWQGERELYNCTHCHDPHTPAVRPRAPEPPPPIRRGLQPMSGHHERAMPYWLNPEALAPAWIGEPGPSSPQEGAQ